MKEIKKNHNIMSCPCYYSSDPGHQRGSSPVAMDTADSNSNPSTKYRKLCVRVREREQGEGCTKLYNSL